MLKRIAHPFHVVSFFTLFFTLFFAPIVFQKKLFTTDGQLAAFFAPIELWSNLWAAGWPMYADTLAMIFNPLRIAFFKVPQGYNLFVLFAYVLAGSFTHGYVYTLTQSHRAGLASGLVFAMSGFMMAHLCHTSMIQAALWLPLVLWGLEKLRRRCSIGGLMAVALGICCSILAGHLQIAVYTICLSGIYSVFMARSANDGWKKYVLLSFLAIMLGIGLATIQLLPTLELSTKTFRSQLTFDEFNAFSLPPKQIPQLLFPHLFGGTKPPYFGSWNIAEISGYVGILPLLLASTAVIGLRGQGVILFWGCVAVLSFLLSLGDAIPFLAKITYHLPPINRFRAPSRHFFEMAFAVSVLAGMAVSALQAGQIGSRTVSKVIVAWSIIFALVTAVIMSSYDKLAALSHDPDFPSIMNNSAIYIPIFIMTISILILYMINRLTNIKTSTSILLMVLVMDMSSYCWFSEWRYHYTYQSTLATPEYIKKYKQNLSVTHQRLLPMSRTMLSDDSYRLYEIPTLGWYGPLILQRYSELSGVQNFGWGSAAILARAGPGIDLLAARYVLLRRPEPTIQKGGGISWGRDNLSLIMGKA